MRFRLLNLVALAALFLAACGDPAATPTTVSGGPATRVPSGNEIKVTFAYSPEKEPWLKERFQVFNDQRIQVNGKTVFVEGKNVSSGAARTQIKSGSLTTV